MMLVLKKNLMTVTFSFFQHHTWVNFILINENNKIVSSLLEQ